MTVRNKELGSRKNIVGPHRLCLTSRVLTLMRMPLTDPCQLWEFPLTNIRRCGYSSCLFFMELGRGSVTGAGELWMESEEASVTHSMHDVILDAMRNCAKEDLPQTRPRTRSSSFNEPTNRSTAPSNLSGPNCWNQQPSSLGSTNSGGASFTVVFLHLSIILLFDGWEFFREFLTRTLNIRMNLNCLSFITRRMFI